MARQQALFAVQVLYPLALTGSLQLDLLRTARRGPSAAHPPSARAVPPSGAA